jgi:hypothetical protein
MSFWDTFWKVWQVRASIRIQEGIENATREARHEKEISENLPKIIQELNSKNGLWNREMEYQRKIRNDEE